RIDRRRRRAARVPRRAVRGHADAAGGVLSRLDRHGARNRARHQEGGTDVAVTSNGRHVSIASQDGTARLWTTADSREMARMTHGAAVTTVDFDARGHGLFTGGEDAAMMRWDVADSAGTRSFVHGAEVRGGAFTRNASSVTSVTKDGAVLLWN